MPETAAGGRAAPAWAYIAPLATYASCLSGFLVWLLRSGRAIPQPGARDVVMIGLATHKASRLLTKEKVTRPLREPFADVKGEGELPRELSQEPQGTGLRRVIGELLICPYCLAQWVGTAFFAGLAVAPRLTRFMAALLSAVAIADFLQPAYRAAERRGAG
ncbi:MAG TPA: DUF1360 domain-containing protein [Solirubrobacterales bacterium]|nr:DUF1360 domain-containing protein [Solirubrobacterales bacterium]